MRIRPLEPRSDAPADLLEAVARARDCGTPGEVREFLDPAPPIANPIACIPDYAVARSRIRQALGEGEEVVLFGDYDCDGITALVQAHDFFRAAGHARISWFVPDRMIHDYGLGQAAVEECVRRRTPRLLIALDCGTPAHGPIGWLKDQGIDCIVIDHHALALGQPPLPAAAHLNPKAWTLPQGPAQALPEMSAAGLAFLIFEQMAADLGVAAWDRERAVILGGLGTVVDVMSLRAINRALVKAALRLANDAAAVARVPGLVAMKEVTDTRKVDARTFGFRWGPRLNASGRLDEATDPVQLLLAGDVAAALPLAMRCHKTNIERREIQRQVEERAFALAEERLARDPSEKVLILCQREWHPGVVGIVASRLRERYSRPSIVCGWHEDGYWKGSGRSAEGFDLGAAVQAARDAGLLLGGGGHRAAAGMKIAPEKVEELRRWMQASCVPTPAEFAPVHEVLTGAAALGESDAKALVQAWCGLFEKLEPFGAGNPRPALMLSRAELRWGPKGKNRRDGGERWAVSAGFSWSGRGYLFADWIDVARADQDWALNSRYDLVLSPSASESLDRNSGRPITYYDWRVVDCARRE